MGGGSSWIDAPFNMATVYCGLSALVHILEYLSLECYPAQLHSKWLMKNVVGGPMADAMRIRTGALFVGVAMLAGFTGYEVGPNTTSTTFTQNLGIGFAVFFGLCAVQLKREFNATLRSCENPCLQWVGNLPVVSTTYDAMNSNPCFGLLLMNVFFCIWFSLYAAGGGVNGGATKEENETMFALVMVAFVWLAVSFLMYACETCCGADCSCAGCECCNPDVKPVQPYTAKPVQPAYGAGRTELPAPVGNAMYSPVTEQPMPVTYDNQPMQPFQPVTYGPATVYPPQPMPMNMP